MMRRGETGTVIDTRDANSGKRRPGVALRERQGNCPNCRKDASMGIRH